MKLNKSKKIFIVWGREMQLSNNLGQALGADVRQVYHQKIWGIKMPAILKYLTQGLTTLFILFKNMPGVVIVQNPPIFAPLTALIYCKLTGAKLAIDSHTAAFLDDKWVKFYGLFKFTAKRAVLNSCHNYKNLEILKSWGVKPAMVMQFYNPVYDLEKLNQPMQDERINKVIEKSNMSVMMVNRFANDDDWQTVVETAKLMSEVNFFITGDFKQIKTEKEKLPDNVILTGYLNHDEFLKLMWRSKVVLAFTLRRDTVLWSIREIMALNKPFITTDSEVLKHYFSNVALFTKSDAKELKEKILQAVGNEDSIKNKIKIFLEEDKIRWEKEAAMYKKYLS
jgi:hypothetical protein